MGRRQRRHRALVAVLGLIAIAGAACSAGPEVELRIEMQQAGFSDSSIECFVDAFDVASLAELDELDIADGESAGDCVGQVFEELLTQAFEDLDSGDWVVNEEDGDGFPSRDDMDQLVEQCRSGDNAACDDLWLVSPFDSPEEALAESCGGRSTEPRMGTCAFWLDE